MMQFLVIVGVIWLLLFTLTNLLRRPEPRVEYVLVREPVDRSGGGFGLSLLIFILLIVFVIGALGVQ